MKKIWLSIIIPCFNVQKYVEKCITSCLQDTHFFYEIICVDDGSNDSTGTILDRISRNNNKENVLITVIHQDNRGLSMARNIALSHAKGEYVWFVDSDDYIQKGCVEKIISFAEMKSYDLIWFKDKWIQEDNNIEDSRFDGNYSVLKQGKGGLEFERCIQEYYGTSVAVSRQILGHVRNYIVKRQILSENSISFAERVIYEDNLFNFFLKQKIDTFSMIGEVLYYYRQQPNSIVHTFTANNREAMIKQIDNHIRIASYLNKHRCDVVKNEYKIELEERIILEIKRAISKGIKLHDKKYVRELYKRLKKDGLYPYKIIFKVKRAPYIENEKVLLNILYRFEFISLVLSSI